MNTGGSSPDRAAALRLWGAAWVAAAAACAPASAQTVLFDFDNAPLHSSLPVTVSSGGLQATLSATGQGFSIQYANALGFTPVGFGGLCVYPNSVFPADLVVDFSATVSGFSIMFAPQELGCDDTARMRATAYLNGVLVGSNVGYASPPGTWPTGTLTYTNAAGFNRVVVHYDLRPPTCQDWGPIFLADNMTATPGGAPPCYANCDGSTIPPLLNVLDFNCFLNRFSAGDPYANCDGSTIPPALNVLDFNCFLNAFAAGCP